MNLRKLRFAAGIAAVAAVLAMAAPASSLPRYTEAFDCDTDGGGYPYYTHALAPGETLTIALTSCETMPVWIESGTVLLNGIDVTRDGGFEVPGDLSRITVTPGTSLWVPEYAILDFPEAKTVANPKGALLDTTKVSVGRNPAQFTVGTTKQIENEGTAYLDSKKDCDLQAGDHVYATSTITVTEKGTYAVRVTKTDPSSPWLDFHPDYFHPFRDMFVVAYPDHERPWNVGSKKLVGCNDDADDSWGRESAMTYAIDGGVAVASTNPWLTMKLKPGKYVLMFTTYETTNTFDWSRGDHDGDSFDSYHSSFTYEVWGPSGALAN